MKKRNDAPSNTERFVPARFIRTNGTVETYHGYMVSDYGRVASMKGNVMKILNPGRTKYEYLQVSFCINGKTYQRTVHRIVLSSFCPEGWSVETSEIDHIDRDPTNNYLGNLVWTDRNGNNANRVRYTLKKIRVTYLDDGHVEEFDNMCAVDRAFNRCLNWCNMVIRKQNGYNKKYNILIEKIG